MCGESDSRTPGRAGALVGAAGTRLGLGLRVAAGEQGHVVAELDQRVGQVGDDALGAAIEPRRDAFVQRGDLGDLHDSRARVSGPGLTPGNVAMSAGLIIIDAPVALPEICAPVL